MLTYKRILNENGIMQYEFYPSGDLTVPGIVEFSSEGEPKLLQDSPKDVKGYFATHALYGIDTSMESGTVAWY